MHNLLAKVNAAELPPLFIVGRGTVNFVLKMLVVGTNSLIENVLKAIHVPADFNTMGIREKVSKEELTQCMIPFLGLLASDAISVQTINNGFGKRDQQGLYHRTQVCSELLPSRYAGHVPRPQRQRQDR